MTSLIDQLPADAQDRVARLLRLGAATPYVRERIEAEYDRRMPTHWRPYRRFCERNGLPWRGHTALSYPVTALLDPGQPWRAMLRAMVRRGDAAKAMVRRLQSAGAPISAGKETLIVAITTAGWDYQRHKPGGRHRPPDALSPCPRCGAIVHRPDHRHCSRACWLAVQKQSFDRIRARTYGPCPRCGKPIRTARRKYCCADCARPAQREGMRKCRPLF